LWAPLVCWTKRALGKWWNRFLGESLRNIIRNVDFMGFIQTSECLEAAKGAAYGARVRLGWGLTPKTKNPQNPNPKPHPPKPRKALAGAARAFRGWFFDFAFFIFLFYFF
jgi:hypothetical protein